MKRKEYLGFTLIELLVTIAIVVILIAFGLPKLTSFTADNRLTSQINRLSADLAYARSEAIRRAANVAITASGGGTNWSGGWTVAMGPATVSAGQPLRISPPLNVSKLTASNTSVIYAPNGALLTATTISFKLCGPRTGPYGKELSIGPTGQTQLTTRVTCP